MGIDMAQIKAAQRMKEAAATKKAEREAAAEQVRQKQAWPSIDCQACKSTASMKPASIPRFGDFIRFIGYLIAAPAVLGAVFCFYIVVNGGFGFAAGGFFLFFIGGLSLVSGLIGYLLLMQKKVLLCSRCGHTLDRA
jgi:hypothetical protein